MCRRFSDAWSSAARCWNGSYDTPVASDNAADRCGFIPTDLDENSFPMTIYFDASRRLVSSFALIAATALSGFADAKPSADDYAWLHVKGSRIMTSASSKGGEEPFIPVGIGYARNVIIRAQDAEVMKFSKEHSLNTVRLCIYTKYFNNKKSSPVDLDDHIRNFIDPVVRAAREQKIYVILDGHEYLSSEIDEETARQKQKTKLWDESDIKAWTDAWVKIATHYKDEPFILGYEIMNEPHDIQPDDARAKLTRCLKAIRTVDTRHIVILSNHNWSHSRSMEGTWGSVAASVDAPHNNVVFSFHDYPEDDHPWKVKKQATAFRAAHQVPVLCTEFGATQWNKSETVCRQFEAGLLAVFAQEDIGWMVWALKKLEDNPRSPYNLVDKVGIGPPPSHDSCQYSDIWAPVARIMASPFPSPISGP